MEVNLRNFPVIIFTSLFFLLASSSTEDNYQMGDKLGVIYDGRSLIINGKREILISGSIHYTRSHPHVIQSLFYWFFFYYYYFLLVIIITNQTNDLMCWNLQMWSEILQKARHGGLNVIQTYVFWNVHEPVQGQVMSMLIVNLFLLSKIVIFFQIFAV